MRSHNALLLIAVLLVMGYFVFLIQRWHKPPGEVPIDSYDELFAAVQAGDVPEIEIDDRKASGRVRDGTKFSVEVPPDPELAEKLRGMVPEGASMTVRTGLEAELARAKAQLMELKSVMKNNAPKVKRARKRVQALAAQVAAEKNKLVDPKGVGGLASSLAEFDEAMVEKEFAEAAYRTALAGLEAARSDAARQHRYVAVVAPPSLPDESTFPERGLGVLTVFIMSFLLMGIASLLVAAVREHARV